MPESIAEYPKYTINGNLVLDCRDRTLENTDTDVKSKPLPNLQYKLLELLCERAYTIKGYIVTYREIYLATRATTENDRDVLNSSGIDPAIINNSVFGQMSKLLSSVNKIYPKKQYGSIIETETNVGYKLAFDVDRDMVSVPCNITSIEDLEANLQSLESIIRTIPRPTPIMPPAEPTEEEDDYIEELYRAYSDREKATIDKTSIDTYKPYADDLKERREDYFAAETVNRGLQELRIRGASGQFEVLKTETYQRVKNIAKAPYSDGYVRMLTVMDTAAGFIPTNYMFAKSPYWIDSQITQGVCHFLVKAGKLKWVLP